MKRADKLLQVVGHLNGAVSNSRLYAADHPQVTRYLERAHQELVSTLNESDDVTFIIVDDEVVVENRALDVKSVQLNQFVRILNRCGIERITFTPDATVDQLRQFVADLAAIDQEVVRSTSGIRLGKVQVRETSNTREMIASMEPETRQQLAALASVRDHSLDEIKELYGQIRATKQISSHGLGEIVQGFLQGMLRNVNPLNMLASLKSSDEYTFTHAINVCILTMAQAESLGISERKLHEIGIAASMHDAGKMFVSEDILNKPDKLTEREWVHMRNHSQHGAQYLLRLEGIPRLAFLAALEHHIRYDGSGYPELGKDWRPNIASQMIAIADFFDAMRSRRPYKDPKPDALIIKIMREEAGTTFNPQLVENFLRLIESKN